MILHPGDTCAKEGNVSRLRVTVDGLLGGHHLLGGGVEDSVIVELGDGINYPVEASEARQTGHIAGGFSGTRGMIEIVSHGIKLFIVNQV